MNYLQLNDKGKLGHDEQKLADYFGEGRYTTFYKKHFLQNRFHLYAVDFIASEIPVMFNAMKKCKILYKHDDYPEPLQSCGSYNMSSQTYSELLVTRWNELKNYGLFER